MRAPIDIILIQQKYALIGYLQKLASIMSQVYWIDITSLDQLMFYRGKDNFRLMKHYRFPLSQQVTKQAHYDCANQTNIYSLAQLAIINQWTQIFVADINLQAFISPQQLIKAMQSDITIGMYTSTFTNLLGKGGFGKVYEGHETFVPNNKVAVKVLKLQGCPNLKKKIQEQIMIMAKYRSQYVINVLAYGVIIPPLKEYGGQQCYAIAMQKMDGTLTSFLQKKKPLTTDQSLEISWKIVKCYYEGLFKKNVIHRDLKPDNVLYRKVGDQLVFKLADLGFARNLNQNPMTTKATALSSLGYTAPQIMRGEGKKTTAKADLYSIAIILSVMLTGSEDILDQTAGIYSQGDYEKSKSEINKILHKAEIAKPIVDFIKACLIYDEQKRMSWEYAYQHQIFKGFYAKKQYFERQQQIKMIQNKNGKLQFALTPDTESWGLRQGDWKLDINFFGCLLGNTNSNVCIVNTQNLNCWLCSSPLPFDGEFVFTIKVIKLTKPWIYIGVMEEGKKGEKNMIQTFNYSVFLNPFYQYLNRPNEEQTKFQNIKCWSSQSLSQCPFQIECHVNRQQNRIAWHYDGKQQAKSTLPKAWKTNKKSLCAIVWVSQKGDSVEMM